MDHGREPRCSGATTEAREAMHEASLVGGLIRKIETVVSEQGGGRVLGVAVKLGALSHISPDHFREHFVEGAKGTVAETARLDIELLADTTDPLAQEILLDSVEVAE
jgi:hydrogenase nickel incorporation protein HypA/HybF